MTRSLKIAALTALALSASVAHAQRPKGAPGTPPPPPLSPMASQHVAVLPVQLFRADSGAWVDLHGWEKFRRELDDSIGSIISNRGVGKAWKYASDLERIAKRNPDYVNDPTSMGVQAMRAVLYKLAIRFPIRS